jgi:20S proteasome alpha/beta subunit
MSTVVGLKTESGVIIGADTRATTPDGEIRPNVCKKIFRNGPYLIGFIGSVRGGQILLPHYFDPPKHILDFPDAIRKQCAEKGCLGVNEENQTGIHACNFLVAYKKELYEVLVDFQLNEVESYTAIGSGSSFAFGSFHTTEDLDNIIEFDNITRVKLALEAAVKFDAASGAPFDIQRT